MGMIISWGKILEAVSYNIYRSENPYLGFELIGKSSVPEYIDTDISNSYKYFYRVTAEW